MRLRQHAVEIVQESSSRNAKGSEADVLGSIIKVFLLYLRGVKKLWVRFLSRFIAAYRQ